MLTILAHVTTTMPQQNAYPTIVIHTQTQPVTVPEYTNLQQLTTIANMMVLIVSYVIALLIATTKRDARETQIIADMIHQRIPVTMDAVTFKNLAIQPSLFLDLDSRNSA